jgi:hypothetical protein
LENGTDALASMHKFKRLDGLTFRALLLGGDTKQLELRRG